MSKAVRAVQSTDTVVYGYDVSSITSYSPKTKPVCTRSALTSLAAKVPIITAQGLSDLRHPSSRLLQRQQWQIHNLFHKIFNLRLHQKGNAAPQQAPTSTQHRSAPQTVSPSCLTPNQRKIFLQHTPKRLKSHNASHR